MAKLTTKSRNALPHHVFGIAAANGQPAKYPMEDRGHAINAKARATQQVKKGNLSPATAEKIKAKANKIIGVKKGIINSTKGG